MEANVILPPARRRAPYNHTTVFLAGAIDNGAAVDWQTQVTDQFAWRKDVTFYNPRRKDWDSSWKQEAANEQFSEQVEWELDKMEEADYVLIVFPKESVAPISLLEFGRLSAASPSKMIVVAEPGYWRRGNLEVVCRRERIAIYDNLGDGVAELLRRIY